MYFTMQPTFSKKVRTVFIEQARVHKLMLDTETTFDPKCYIDLEIRGIGIPRCARSHAYTYS